MPDEVKKSEPEDVRPAASTDISLSQALLAPLDAIFKAQVHSARSFINFLFQIGYPPKPDDGKEPQVTDAEPKENNLYQMSFSYGLDGERQKISIPILALVPISPIGVQSAEFEFDFFVRNFAKHMQLRKSERINEPEDPKWFLVDDPQSLRGTFAPEAPKIAQSKASGKDKERNESFTQESQSRIKIKVNVGAIPQPAALEKLLATLGQMTRIEKSDSNGKSNPPPQMTNP